MVSTVLGGAVAAVTTVAAVGMMGTATIIAALVSAPVAAIIKRGKGKR